MHGDGERSEPRRGPKASGKTARANPDGRSILLPGLWAARAFSGLSQRDLAGISGTSHNTVFALETLSRGAYPRTVRKLCRALEVEPQDLIRENPSKKTKGSTMSKTVGGMKDGTFVLRVTYNTKDKEDMDELKKVMRDPDTVAEMVASYEDRVEVDIRPGW